MSTRIALLPRCLFSLFFVGALCQLAGGCRSAVLPHWEPASEGIKPQSDVIVVAFAAHDPQSLFMATYDPGGLYRSRDGGLSWQNSNTGLEGVTVVSIACSPLHDQTILAGTVSGGYRSVDGGHSWAPVANLPAAYVYALAWAPDGSAIFAGTEELGIHVSIDDGLSWSSIGPEGASVLSLDVSPDGTIYAGTSGEGIWLSHDGGVNWRAASEDVDDSFVPNLTVTSAGTVWALADGRVFKSADRGETWSEAGAQDWETRSMAVHPQSGQTLYLGGRDGGVAVSQDGGQTWHILGNYLADTDFISLAVAPTDPGTAYLGTKGSGLFKTTDGGQTWLSSSGDVGKKVVTALAQNPQRSHILFAGTIHGVYRSTNGAQSWNLTTQEASELYVQALAVDPRDGETIYAGTDRGIYVSRDGGESWVWASRALGGLTIFCLTIDPHQPDMIYAGSWGNNVLRSLDGGRSWSPIHHGLETLSVHSLAVSPEDPRIIYVGTVEDIYKSADAGESWRTVEGLREGITTFALLFDPSDSSIVYAGTTDGLYRSVDEAETWTPKRSGLGEVTVTSLAAERNSGVLYAGTEHRGLFRSLDGGEQWTPWGFEDTSVYAIVIDQATTTLWVATEKGVFRWES